VDGEKLYSALLGMNKPTATAAADSVQYRVQLDGGNELGNIKL
jgi:hypothetical protein